MFETTGIKSPSLIFQLKMQKHSNWDLKRKSTLFYINDKNALAYCFKLSILLHKSSYQIIDAVVPLDPVAVRGAVLLGQHGGSFLQG